MGTKIYFLISCLIILLSLASETDIFAQSEDVFGDYLLPGEKKEKKKKKEEKIKSEKDIFSDYLLPEEKKKAPPDNIESLFTEYEVLPKTETKVPTEPVRSVGPVNIYDKVEETGEDALSYLNPYNLYYKLKKTLKKKKSPPPKSEKEITVKEEKPPETPDTEKKYIADIEKEILENKEIDLSFQESLKNLDTLTLEEKPEKVKKESTEDITQKVIKQMEKPPIHPSVEEKVAEEPEEEEISERNRWLKLTYSEDLIYYDMNDSVFNPHNRLEVAHSLHRYLITATIDNYEIYNNPSSILSLKLYAKDTAVYFDQVPEESYHLENYLQEAYLFFRYQQLTLRAGKINLQPGDASLSWNPTDYFKSFYNPLASPSAGNSRGLRPGIYGVEGGYSFSFGDLSIFYSPDLTHDGDIRENSEFVNNIENIYYSKFSWILFEPGALIGPWGMGLEPSSPEFSFSYFEQKKLLNLGLTWSIGIGDSMILKLETNYSNRTDIYELVDLPPLVIFPIGSFRLLTLEKRRHHDWQTVLGFTYTPGKFNINVQYFYNSNGLSRKELSRYFDNAKFLKENLDFPFLGEYYFAVLASALDYSASTIGRHYFSASVDHTSYWGDKKRPLTVGLFGLINLQDYSGSVGTRVTYKFFTYAQIEAGFTALFGKEDTIYGEYPIKSYCYIALSLFNF